MQKEISVIESNNALEFEKKVNEHLATGWQILSTSSGFINNEQYNYCSVFQAILVKN